MFPLFRAGGAACAALLVLTQLGPSTSAGSQTGASRFALAMVTDPRGKATVDIDADGFVVQEGTATREILDVRVADYPVVVVVDNGSRSDFPSIKPAVARFVERLGPRPVSIVTAGGEPQAIASFEDERSTLLARLDDVDVGVESRPLRAAALAGEMIHGTGSLFSAIVLVTASSAETADVDALLAPIIDSRAVVHIVAHERAAASPTLRGLARQTQGNYTSIYAAASYSPAIDRLVDRLTTELLIEYLVPVGSKASDPKIGVRIPGARVRGLGVAPR